MANLLVVILHDATYLPDLLQAWQDVGLPGTTILDSVGAYRTAGWLEQVGLGAIGDLFTRGEQSKTLLAAIDDDALLEEAIITIEEITGNLDAPHTGLYFVIPLARSGGITNPMATKKAEEGLSHIPKLSNDLIAITRNTLISDVDKILKLNPTIVHPEQDLMSVAEAMTQHARSNVACVVNHEERLIGLIPLRLLADDLFLSVMPGEFLRSLTIDTVEDFAKMIKTNTARDAMIEAVWVKKGDQVKDAFHKMHEKKMSAVPIVNEKHQVIGIINLLELLALLIRGQKTSNK